MSQKIGLVGCGAIGQVIARFIDRGQDDLELVALLDRNPERALSLQGELRSRPPLLDLDDLVERSDLVVEAASQQAVREVALTALARGKNMMIMSVGALMDADLYRELVDLARQRGGAIQIPSGAISGLDGIKSARMGRIDSITLTTTKSPASLEGAPYLLEKGIDLRYLKQAEIIFRGPAREAVKAFPANVNVAATLSLAWGGEVQVEIVADPEARVNIHEITVQGEFGRMKVRVENVPSPDNPRTSYLAALSALATLRGMTSPLRLGT